MQNQLEEQPLYQTYFNSLLNSDLANNQAAAHLASADRRLQDLLEKNIVRIQSPKSETRSSEVRYSRIGGQRLRRKLNDLSKDMSLLQQQQSFLRQEKQANLDLAKLHKLKRQRQQRQLDRREKQTRLVEQQEQRVKQEQSEAERRLKEKRLMMVEEGIRKIKEREQKRKQEVVQGNKKLKQFYQRQPLFLKLQQNYKQKIVLPEIEERSNKLQQIKVSKPSLDRQAIQRHQKEYSELLLNRQLNREQSRQSGKSEYVPPEGSGFWQRLLQQQQKARAELDAQKRYAFEINKQKQLEFLKNVRENHVPKIKQIAATQVIPSRRVPSLQQFREKGNSNLQHAKRLADHNRVLKDQERSVTTRKQTKDFLKHYDSQQITEARIKELDKIKDMKLDTHQKLKILRNQAQRLQAKADTRDTLLKLQDNPRVRQEVTDLLLRSIRAKTNMIKLSQEKAA